MYLFHWNGTINIYHCVVLVVNLLFCFIILTLRTKSTAGMRGLLHNPRQHCVHRKGDDIAWAQRYVLWFPFTFTVSTWHRCRIRALSSLAYLYLHAPLANFSLNRQYYHSDEMNEWIQRKHTRMQASERERTRKNAKLWHRFNFMNGNEKNADNNNNRMTIEQSPCST